MKILAVIPARAGSKGIPNKNIRIVNGKPLIAYCIENALKSKYITDVIITTDSQEIELLAGYYGVRYLHRKEELCGDSVALDAVVYDACKDFDAGYIITLQPTSPTLQYSTLDRAIEYAVVKNLDTVISVVNKPHLAWVEKDGQVIPDYKKRLNRQYLPKRFLEAGAFVISKKGIVSQNSRIGKTVDVYEISESEAIDIDNFQDLISAENTLRERKTAIIVNGNNLIGMGHICRMLELSDLFYHKPDLYYDNTVTNRSSFGNTMYKVTGYNCLDDLLAYLRDGEYQVIINDVLDTEPTYIKTIKQIPTNPYVVNFEDAGDGRRNADLIINALYQEEQPAQNIYFGERYYLIPKLFLLYKPIKIKEEVSNVFVCFGGADPENYTEKVLSFISRDEYSGLKFTVVLGKAKSNYIELQQKNKSSNIRVLYDVKNMPEIMSQSDVGITSRGRTCYELASLGIPTIAMSQNEREERHEFASAENGFIYLGREVTEELIKKELDNLISTEVCKRKAMQQLMLKHDLKKGRERIKNLIDSL
jgi:CMP-N-acetylneuraminic acid synthetase/spore coat polysaccharide biosynthesis predicted glycosyltransferase SpsG